MSIGAFFARLIVFVLVAMTLNACGKSGSGSEKPQSDQAVGALSPPTPFSMSVNLNVADNGTDLDALFYVGRLLSAVTSGANYLQAMIYVSAVDINVGQPLRLPFVLLKASSAKKPLQNGTDTWVYSFDVLENNRVWTANLVGSRVSSTATSWSMTVTSTPSGIDGCCKDFLLFEGLSSTSGSGNWQIFDITKPRESEKLFSIVYDFKSPTDKILSFAISGNSS